ncbi:MAG: hypothetical protein PHN74_02665 [Candidatus Pacebacteria bacterium]|nr:hypothetical protein [Candidatus Paceibacterota bacterium]
MFKKLFTKKRIMGIAALPTLLILGGAVFDTALIVTAGAYYLNKTDYGVRLSAESLGAAKAGIQDGIMRLSRDKSFTSSGYTISNIGKRSSAFVVICKDTAECGGSGKYKISSIGTSFTRKKKMEAVIAVNPNTGQITSESMKEVAL